MPEKAPEVAVVEESCPQCQKPLSLCICDGLAQIDNRVFVLILQHPQEQDRALGTARLTALQLKNSLLKIGLSWPSLTKVLGREANPARWAVLYLGSVKAADIAPEREIVAVDHKGQPSPTQSLREVEGIILLDGTWSQAKALWWRNAWLLKCRRIVLGPKARSRYGELRREPRDDGLATIEAAALLLAKVEGRADIEQTLMASFERMLAKYRSSGAAKAARPKKKDWRRRRGPAKRPVPA